MDIRQLRYFLTLADELHFGRASEKLFIVQPALTKQIQGLENELNVTLFKRNKRKVELTGAGRYFREEVKQIVEKLDRVKAQTRLVQEGDKGELRIGYVGSCIHTFLPDMLIHLHERNPHIQTYLNEMTTSSQRVAIESGELDIAFLRNPLPHTDLGQHLVYSEPFSLILPHNHSINEINFKGIEQLKYEKFILPPKNDGELYYQLQLSICEQAGFSPRIAHETVHGHTVLNLVDHGLGITFLPSSFQKVTTAKVKFIPLEHIAQKAEITAVWNLHNPNPSLGKFLNVVRKMNDRP
ncbi:LysR substrate-binding domain-containing protein [Anditalea andensis]|uniref:LysR family transcriptional regulator n=1 Tax=Anditalea andensis TaxID=1048983 RepID=A0A074KXC7_9BACT|nr:LysR substrate-binding domain-containing protein [Anditalea andensis]KEO73594.1 LysR family transcriptional regulator [Anditalea andensis]